MICDQNTAGEPGGLSFLMHFMGSTTDPRAGHIIRIACACPFDSNEFIL